MFDIANIDVQKYLIMAPGLLIALVFHEVAHGYVAYVLGDPTAKMQGRLNLNPFRHLDPLGTLAFFFVSFGWAKPVPVDMRYFRNPRQGMMLTALAGPSTNFMLAAVFAAGFHLMPSLGVGSHSILYSVAYFGVLINLILGAFNLLPIPPLDGSNIVAYFLPPRLAHSYMRFSRYGFVLLIGIILLGNFTGFSLFGRVIMPIVRTGASLLGMPFNLNHPIHFIMSDKQRILSGMRPTGLLHLGHYFGVIDNWLKLQEEYDCFFMVADWHALTSEYANPTKIKGFVPGLVKDWVAAGLDPEKCAIFQQSMIKEHAELYLLFSMYTPLGWLERCPTYKDQIVQLASKELNTHGFLGYPVLQAVDILLYKPEAVPVGKDQLPHLELTREIARRFNHLNDTDLFPEPADMLTEAATLPGLDGRKMSKSYGNSIMLSEPMEEIMPKVRGMKTDENRLRKSDPGDPDICNLFPYHKLMTDPDKLPEIEEGCRNASWGCVDCKKVLMESLERFLTPLHERRAACTDERVQEILEAGNAKARAYAEKTMDEVRKVLNFDF